MKEEREREREKENVRDGVKNTSAPDAFDAFLKFSLPFKLPNPTQDGLWMILVSLHTSRLSAAVSASPVSLC